MGEAANAGQYSFTCLALWLARDSWLQLFRSFFPIAVIPGAKLKYHGDPMDNANLYTQKSARA
jgi:hypothetical protein